MRRLKKAKGIKKSVQTREPSQKKPWNEPSEWKFIYMDESSGSLPTFLRMLSLQVQMFRITLTMVSLKTLGKPTVRNRLNFKHLNKAKNSK